MTCMKPEDGWQKVLQKPRASDRQSGLNSNVANNKHIRAAFDTTIASLWYSEECTTHETASDE
eukprot:764791-Hanusia_phi.AAC.2